MRIKRKARNGLALGIELDQIEGQFLQAAFYFFTLLVPLAAAQVVELGRVILGADKLLNPLKLVKRYIELVAAPVVDQEVVTPRAFALETHRALIDAYAVVLMHHIVAHTQVCERFDALAGTHAGFGLLLPAAQYIRIGQQDDAGLFHDEAAGIGNGVQGGDAAFEVRREIMPDLQRAFKLAKGALHAQGARLAAAQDGNGIFVRDPLLDVERKLRESALETAEAAALHRQGKVGFQPGHAAKQFLHGDDRLRFQPRHDLPGGIQQMLLGGESPAMFQCQVQILRETLQPLIQPREGTVRRIHHDDRILKQVAQMSGFRVEDIGPQVHAGEIAAVQQPFDIPLYGVLRRKRWVFLFLRGIELPGLQRGSRNFQGLAHTHRRFLTVLRGNIIFKRGTKTRGIQPACAALCQNVKRPDGIDHCVEELDAYGLVALRGENV